MANIIILFSTYYVEIWAGGKLRTCQFTSQRIYTPRLSPPPLSAAMRTPRFIQLHLDHIVNFVSYYACLYRYISQFHYTGWPEHGVPRTTFPMLDFITAVYSTGKADKAPMVVHCGTGNELYLLFVIHRLTNALYFVL